MSLAEAKVEQIRAMKNGALADTSRVSHDLTPMLDVWRDGRLVAAIICRQVDRDEALNAAGIAVPGLGADAVVMVFDAHMTSAAVNPATGERWGPNEMQKLCDDGDACDTGLITDCMVIQEVHRDGSGRLITLPYHVHKTARTIAWFPGDDPVASTSVEGLIADTLRDAFRQPDLFTFAQKEYPGDLPHDARLHTDIAVTNALAEAGYLVKLIPANGREREIINEARERWAKAAQTAKMMETIARLEGRNN